MPENIYKRLRYRGRRLRDHMMGHLPEDLRAAAWQTFLRLPDAQWVCWIISQIEPQHVGLFPRRARHPKGWVLFDDLPTFDQRIEARWKFERLCAESNLRLPEDAWLVPILAGRARDLLLRPEAHGSEWGRRSRRVKGGKHTQERYREMGWHPLPSVRKAWGLTGDRPQK